MGKSAERIVKYVLSEDQINNIVAIAADEGIKSYREEQRKAEVKKKRENKKVKKTKKLLSSYR